MNVERNNRLNRKVGAGAVTIGLTIVAAFGLVAWHKAFGAGWAQVAYAFAPVVVALGAFLFNRQKSANIDVAQDDASDVSSKVVAAQLVAAADRCKRPLS